MVILIVSLLHLIWGLMVLLHRGPIHIAATWAVVQLIPDAMWQVRALVYVIAALMPLVLWKWPNSLAGLLSVIPQQCLLLLSGISTITAVMAGHYADGTVRAPEFIMMDQVLFLILAFFHAFNVIDRWIAHAGK